MRPCQGRSRGFKSRLPLQISAKPCRSEGFFHFPGVWRLPTWTFSAYDAKLRDRARYPSGKGEVCKTFIRGFDSHPRLQVFLAHTWPKTSVCGQRRPAYFCDAGSSTWKAVRQDVFGQVSRATRFLDEDCGTGNSGLELPGRRTQALHSICRQVAFVLCRYGHRLRVCDLPHQLMEFGADQHFGPRGVKASTQTRSRFRTALPARSFHRFRPSAASEARWAESHRGR